MKTNIAHENYIDRKGAPGVTAVQVRLQLFSVSLPSPWWTMSTLLLLDVMIGGRKKLEEDGSWVEKPQLLSNKTVPSLPMTWT